VYSLSVKELEKIVHALDLAGLAYKNFNDYYIKGCEFENANENNKMFNKIKSKIFEKDAKAKKWPMFYGYDLVTTVIFKNSLEGNLKNNMAESGFRFINKIENPYLAARRP
jgi:hypothetical protein